MSRINAARKAVGDNGQDQRLIRTPARKGFFARRQGGAAMSADPARLRPSRRLSTCAAPPCRPLPGGRPAHPPPLDRPGIAVCRSSA